MIRTLTLISLAALPLTACSSIVTTDDCDGAPPVTECGTFECVGGEWEFDESSCNLCPVGQPTDGTPCDAEGLVCRYAGEGPCGPPGAEVAVECVGSVWVSQTTRCTLPPCPVEQPAIGSDCGAYGLSTLCSYFVQCDSPVALNLTCVDDGTGPKWSPSSPEPVCGTCEAATDPASCAANPSCAWRVPGCDDEGNVAIQEGCYPAEDCSTSLACSDPSRSCVVVVVDPCWDSMCDACGAQLGVCMAP
jgi:hypothetical protein